MSLRVIVFDVEQGFCAFVRSRSGYTLMIDCGMGQRFSPIEYILGHEFDGTREYDDKKLTKLILSHPHQDHLADIDRLKEKFPPAIIKRRKYDWGKIREPGEPYQALDAYVEWQKTYNQPVTSPLKWGMEINDKLGLSQSEALKLDENKFVNNSSIPVMIKYVTQRRDWKFFFPGDIEESGWKQLLRREEFCNALEDTDFFITAHHGHSSGYCKEIFDRMGRPHFNIVSTHKRDESVETAYSTPSCARGVEYQGKTRYMFSTRYDGSIFIDITNEGKATFILRRLADNI